MCRPEKSWRPITMEARGSFSAEPDRWISKHRHGVAFLGPACEILHRTQGYAIDQILLAKSPGMSPGSVLLLMIGYHRAAVRFFQRFSRCREQRRHRSVYASVISAPCRGMGSSVQFPRRFLPRNGSSQDHWQGDDPARHRRLICAACWTNRCNPVEHSCLVVGPSNFIVPCPHRRLWRGRPGSRRRPHGCIPLPRSSSLEAGRRRSSSSWWHP